MLSKIIIFVTRHNFSVCSPTVTAVVNCFQKLLSSWHDTTVHIIAQKNNKLWIAFKNYYLRDTTQHVRIYNANRSSCELLSKIIIFVTRHNISPNSTPTLAVVNCFQKLLSSWHDTTLRMKSKRFRKLWIAFKNYYLRDTTQPA